ncbi:MAG TPA: hypothetical protein VIV06_11960, partial [Candidatus Limnocylindrales bacterium]
RRRAGGPNPTPDAVNSVINERVAAISADLQGDRWRDTFPGKEILRELGRVCGLGTGPVLSNALIRNLAAHPERAPRELQEKIGTIVGRDPLARCCLPGHW